MNRIHGAALAGVVAGALAAPAGAQGAQALIGVTQANRIVTFHSDSPGHVQRAVGITGLAAGDEIVGLDVRPATGQLYGLGSGSRIYVIDATSGQARQVGADGAFALSGTAFGFDFNPTVDRIRLISDTGQNLRLHPETGAVAATDGPLAGPEGPATGVTGAAYTNSVLGATSTTLFDLDTARDRLVRQDPPNAGTLVPVGALGVDAGDVGGFDIAPDGTAFAAIAVGDSAVSTLHRVDLTTGAATPAAASPAIGTGERLRGVTVAGPVADDRSLETPSVALSSTQLRSRLLTLGIRATVACDEACTVSARVSIAGRSVGGPATATTSGSGGNARVALPLDAAGREAVRRSGRALLRVTFEVTDAAGNRATIGREVRERAS